METMNLLDITIKYFNVIVFLLCVVFGMISLFASWVAWRELHRKRNIIRSVIAAYNIAEDAVDKGRTPSGDLELDPAIVQTIFNSLQEILNAVHGEITGKPIPPREDRVHGSRKIQSLRSLTGVLRRKGKESGEKLDVDKAVPALVADDREHHQHCSHP